MCEKSFPTQEDADAHKHLENFNAQTSQDTSIQQVKIQFFYPAFFLQKFLKIGILSLIPKEMPIFLKIIATAWTPVLCVLYELI